ncbi:MAG: hypothetical protein IKM08_05805 [Clostridia bacterium]|nr:hypothetical protein [Clostridia bacterium]
MRRYEHLLDEACEKGLTVIENYPFRSERIRGMLCDDTIALSEQIDTEAERTVVLCEELTHAERTVGDILSDPRLERRARQHNFDRLVGREGLVRAYLAGCRELWEFADFLGVPEAFLAEAMANYRERYGTLTTVTTEQGSFALTFEPTLCVKRLMRAKKPARVLRTHSKNKEATS